MLSDYNASEIDEFLGPWLTTGPNAFEAGDVPRGRGLMAQNVEYKPGQVRTRYGFSPITNLTSLGDSFQSMEGWLAPIEGQTNQIEFLAYLAATGSTHPGFNIIRPDTGTAVALWVPSAGAAAAVFAPSGLRLYMCAIDIHGNGTDPARVYSNTSISGPGGLDTLFQPPIAVNSFTFADGGPVGGGALGVTVGKHNFGILLTTRNGYTGAPSPGTVDGNGIETFTPVAFTVTVAGDELLVSVNANWPVSVTGAQLFMTTADNLAQYYLVPNGTLGVTGGTTSTIIFNVAIDDGTLAATATDATPFFDLYAGQIHPSSIAEYSNRLVYCAPDTVGVQTVFISDPNNYQSISLDRSVYYLPGDKQALTTFNLYGNLYIVGPHWTYQTIDNGGDPVTWAPPTLIDGQIGSLSPNGITVNSSQGVAWVADVDGLYMFSGGAYANRPISYYIKSDWVRINWNAAGCLRVIDSKDTQRIHVIAPLDSATTPSHVLTFDYSRGATPENINYSLDTYGSFTAGAIAIVISPADNHLEVWLGPSNGAQPVLRQNDGTGSNPYRDNGAAINSTYQTGLLPQLTENVLHHVGDHLRITGNGTLNLTASTLDGSISKTLVPITLGPAPAEALLRLYHILSEASTVTFNVNTLDAAFVLSALVHYSKELVVFR